MSDDEQVELVLLARIGAAAKEAIVTHTRGLVSRIAYEYAARTAGVEVDDLIQEGQFAVLDAVRWYDPARGYRWSTYAGGCVARRLAKSLRLRAERSIPRQEPAAEAGANAMDAVIDGRSLATPRPLDELAELSELSALERAVVTWHHTTGGTEAESFGSLACRLGVATAVMRGVYDRAIAKLRRRRGIPAPSDN